MVIVIGNGIGDISLNSEQGHLRFTLLEFGNIFSYTMQLIYLKGVLEWKRPFFFFFLFFFSLL